MTRQCGDESVEAGRQGTPGVYAFFCRYILRRWESCLDVGRGLGLGLSILKKQTVLVEAMACGLPLITSDFGPLVEVNLHGKTGFVVSVGDASAWADAIRAFYRNREILRTMGKSAVERSRLFLRGEMIRKTMGLYQQITAPSHRDA